jgi:DinB family protein
MKRIIILFLSYCFALAAAAQTNVKEWTETDRRYLYDNLFRSSNELQNETANLTKEQWEFKESPDRWSIKEVVEHICLWELLFQREISQALSSGPKPDPGAEAKPDSFWLTFIMEEKPHISTDYTKPFTFSLPMGLNEGQNNVAWFMKMRNESIEYIKTTNDDLRVHRQLPGRGNLHQVYILTFGHTDRHLRQIRKIRANPEFPK